MCTQSKATDYTFIENLHRTYTEGGCYRFACVTGLITGWKVKDLRTDACLEVIDEKYVYPMSSHHGFCIDHVGNAFDVRGAVNMKSFTKTHSKVLPELVGTYHMGRQWTKYLSWNIVDFDLRRTTWAVFSDKSILDMSIDTTDEKSRLSDINNIIQVVYDVMFVISKTYEPEIVSKSAEKASELLFSLYNEKKFINFMRTIIEACNIRRELINKLNFLMHSITTSKQSLEKNAKIVEKKNAVVNYDKIKDESKRQALIANDVRLMISVKETFARHQHKISVDESEIAQVKKKLSDTNKKLFQFAAKYIPVIKHYQSKRKLYPVDLFPTFCTKSQYIEM
jgi:hypothetical protein